eukprot:TRINITY_DN4371_c0_g1_i8.p1 TRINITY_DN4371_c0_g1~~TRINITY_DN4371_c0_g1_i8.p1  ORF type:complete len:183 (-),score=44.52 TRINITY_DN4371_c0_g1_i8:617-1165(-)
MSQISKSHLRQRVVSIVVKGPSVATPKASSKAVKEESETKVDDEIYTWAKLWKSLSVDGIEKLRIAFDKGRERQLNIYEFINVVRDLALSKNIQEARLQVVVRELTELFNRIDVNGDGQMTWDEFSAFIVDNADAVLGDSTNVRLLVHPPTPIERLHTETCDKIFHFHAINKYIGCCQVGSH